MDMNYLEVVLQGYFNENNREFLDKYFFREFKKAEKEHFFEADEFFNGCLKFVDILKENYKKQYIEIQSELNNYLVSVKKEDRDNEFIEQKKEEIEFLKLNGNTNFRLSNGKNVILKIEEISYIQNAIVQAFEKTKPEIEQLQPQPTNNTKEVSAEPKEDDKSKPTETVNKYPRIFKNDKGYLLFEKLHEHYKDDKHHLANYSFIFWQMIEDKFIFEDIGNSKFRNFLSENYNITLDKLKTKETSNTGNKKTIYTLIKQDTKT
jgi:hypothetical protein